MKEQEKIPVSRVQRASKFLSTGAKVGGNYIKHYSKKLFDPELNRDELNEDNARDIYNSLSELKGSALKVAQMLSMDKNLLPQAYQDKFSMAQYSAPPLSYPLVQKTFQKYFDKSPAQLFDSFSIKAENAASIGQVHIATLAGKKLAVKIQYPGVADSVKSDLRMVKPMASRLFNINTQELEQYIVEVEERLLEETDYTLELKRSMELSKACSHLPNIVFPTYYPDLSSEKILVMDWIEGRPLKDYLKENPTQEKRNEIGQALWDFYNYQMHELRQVHADPHPGNFIITKDDKLCIIDFGCVKEIPNDFYEKYFALIRKDTVADKEKLDKLYYELGFISEQDTEKEITFFKSLFNQMINLLGRPFYQDTFDFSNEKYFREIFETGDKYSRMKEVRNSKSARGPRHALYINRTFFGLYNILHDLKAEIKTTSIALA
ncbi:MAG TPA: lipopolysaccharide core heptose(II) kinase RfaY [Cyclobacteriaceae bacterium]|nr:lipopolysaccharide core heptose(II) kinase RfaY [Cyclobacteriaceae bacterium]